MGDSNYSGCINQVPYVKTANMATNISFKNKQKEKLLDEWLQELDHVLIHLDSRKDGVIVPENFQNNPTLTFKLSYNFQGQLSLEEDCINAYLKFSGEYSNCVIPWESLWGITGSDERNKIWSEDVPKELLLQMAKQKLGEIKNKLFGKKKGDEEQTIDPDGDGGGSRKRKPSLKRVK